MFVCSKCGAHYNPEFLQCPQCGSTKRVTEAEDKNNNSVIGSIISIVIILGLFGLIGLGVYYLLNPVQQESAIVYEGPTSSTTTTSTTTKETTTTTTTTRLTTTTTKLIGTENQPIGNYTYTIPEGFTIIPLPEDLKVQFGLPENTQCINNDLGENYCLSIIEGKNFRYTSLNAEEVNAQFRQNGYSDIIKAKFYGKEYYYSYRIEGDRIIGGIYKNKSSDTIMAVFNIIGTTVNEESMLRIVSIINTIK